MKQKRGSILIETLLGLSLAIMVLGIMGKTVELCSYIKFDSILLQNQIGIIQLREHLLKAYDFTVEEDVLSYCIEDEYYRLSLVNNRLMQQSGTLIFLLDVDTCSFEEVDEAIFINYESKGNIYSRLICYIHYEET